jgi:hypothetical protein
MTTVWVAPTIGTHGMYETMMLSEKYEGMMNREPELWVNYVPFYPHAT